MSVVVVVVGVVLLFLGLLSVCACISGGRF
jgi:hypothetical protein